MIEVIGGIIAGLCLRKAQMDSYNSDKSSKKEDKTKSHSNGLFDILSGKGFNQRPPNKYKNNIKEESKKRKPEETPKRKKQEMSDSKYHRSLQVERKKQQLIDDIYEEFRYNVPGNSSWYTIEELEEIWEQQEILRQEELEEDEEEERRREEDEEAANEIAEGLVDYLTETWL